MLLRPPPAPQYVTANQNPVGGDINQPDPLPDTDDDSDDGDSHDVSTSDFIIMQSSFECKSLMTHFMLLLLYLYASCAGVICSSGSKVGFEILLLKQC